MSEGTAIAPVAERTHRRRWIRKTAIAAVVVVLVFCCAFAAWVSSLGPLPLTEARKVSTTIIDRNGKLLRAYAMADGRWRLPVDAKKAVDPSYVDLLLGYEDQRFREHGGVDPWAMGRAAYQLITRGHIVSGGSTITMQLARLMEEPAHHRSLYAKLRQIVRAIEIERQLDKDQILNLYLALAPFGGNLEGIRAASIAYFGKEPKRLSLAEAALLVALPQSPESRRLDRYPERARDARDHVLDRMVTHRVTADDAAQAKATPVPTLRKPMPILAPHSSDQAISTWKDEPVIKLTLDAGLQKVLEPLARDRAIALGPNISVGVIAIDNATGDVLARVGSAGYFDASRAGQVDMTRAVRSPGSTLKPFIYGLAFEDGFVHPESLIDDRPIRFGSYAPENFDLTYQGTVPVKRALQQSLNVPAIALLDRVGSSRLSARLKQAGANLVLPKEEAPGLAMGLGGVGVTLQDLAMLYAGLPRLGSTKPLREIMDGGHDVRETMRLMDPVAAWQVANVLMGTPPPENGVGGRIAFKTGTSYGYRDAWSVGFDGRITIGVWVGRPDGAPVPGLIGRSAAAPILFDAFARTGKLPVPLPKAPKDALIATNAKLPLPLRRFRAIGELVRSGGAQALHIQFPLNGSRIDVDRSDGPDAAVMPVRVAGGAVPMTVLVNGRSVGEIDGRRQRLIDPPGPGFARLTVIDAAGAADTVVVRIQ
jgi:penicillin-binding protein 1C